MIKIILLALGLVLLVLAGKSLLSRVETTGGSRPSPVSGPTVIDSQGNRISFDEFADRLMAYEFISVGELHDSEAHHRMQLRIIQAVYARDRSVGVGMEMFQRPFQDALDRHIAGNSTEDELLAQTEYQTRWGFPWPLYQPIVEYARQNRIPVAALNAPVELTRRIKQVGYEGLTRAEKDQLGPVDFHVQAHRDHWLPMLGHMHGNRTPTPEEKERSYQIMTVWDDYMAQSAADFRKERHLKRMIVLAGGRHVEGGFGIPDRVARYSGGRSVTVGIVVGGVNDQGPALPVDFLICVNPDLSQPGPCSSSNP